MITQSKNRPETTDHGPRTRDRCFQKVYGLWSKVFSLFCALNFVIWFACFVYAEDADKFIYDSHGKRDPFIPLVGLPHIRTAVSEIMSINDVDFQGIARDARGRRIVIINGEMLTTGSKKDVLKVLKITDDEAIVIIREKKYTLNLYEKGGEQSD